MQGIICVNKPRGWTSFDVVNKIKHIYNTSKVGHLGTLDPMAEGVLPVAIGRATKLFDYYLKKSKSYIAEFEFGRETDTLDNDGKTILTTDIIPSKEEITKILPNFLGEIMQTPPKYSAVKINGRRAYDLARKDIDFEIKPKPVKIDNFICTKQISPTTFEFVIDCSAGTYIRSLARDVAKMLNTVATMTKLMRVRSGEFELKDVKTIEEVEANPPGVIIPLKTVLKSLPRIQVNEQNLFRLENGVKIQMEQLSSEISTIFVGDVLFGIGKIVDGRLVVTTRLYEGEKE